MNEIISILTGIGDLQATISNNAISDDDVMERLNTMRRAALAILNEEGTSAHAAHSYRQEALGKADALGVMIGLEDLKKLPDSTLFRIAAAADNMANATRSYLKMRNLLAAEAAWRETKRSSQSGGTKEVQ